LSQNRRQFLKSTATFASVLVLPALAGCDEDEPAGPTVNESWQSRASELEAVLHSAATGTGTKPEVHIPVATYDASTGMVVVDVPHVMEADHYITTVYIKDQDGVVLGLVEYPTPSASGESPSESFAVHDSTTQIMAYAYCNLHDNWVDAGTSV
jgi:desulfoferrodoxin (superoxide reductase-like protein)